MSPTRRRRSRLVWVLAVVLVGAAAAAAFLLAPRLGGDTEPQSARSGTSPKATSGETDGPAASSSAPYTIEPDPTEVATDEPVPDDAKTTVVLTYAAYEDSSGTVQANGFVSGVIEDGGTCTLTLTRGDDVVTARSTAVADATTTSCGLMETGTDLSAGSWEAVLSYVSDAAEGTSQTVAVPVR